MNRKRNWPLIWLVGFIAIVGIHVVWEVLDESPPVWDMAYHQLQGWRYLTAWQEDELLEQFSQISTYYPPLYYLQEALFLRFFPQTQFLALLSNVLGLFLLSYCSYRIAALFMKPVAAVVTGLLPLLFPLVVWTSRVSLLDLPLAGWVTAAGYLTLRSDFLQNRAWTLAFGIVCAAGSLTKWTFVLFLIFPLIYALIYSPYRRKSLVNLIGAALLAAPLVLWWYLPNLQVLIERSQITAQAGIWEGDPGWDSMLGWIYYPRALSSYYLYLPLTVLFVWGTIVASKEREEADQERVRFLWWWLLGGLVLLMLLPAKDPRYIMPLISPLAILLVTSWRRRSRWIIGILVLAFLQFLSVSFPMPFSPLKIALFDLAEDTDYRSMRQEWVLYQTHYFDIAGPPDQADWKNGEILKALGSAGRIGFLPDAASFNPVTFQLFAARRGTQLEVIFLGESQNSAETLSSLSFVIGKTGSQGLSYMTAWNHPTYRLLEQLNWPLVQTWELPDQSEALLWRNPTLSQ
ncbi:glycosyltransferase family 39 protein [Acidobacteria bacterium AH-259-D05]|nr:glycosyltransferase family 39 protein [Acidobacteria bacterium AH-259-D05]